MTTGAGDGGSGSQGHIPPNEKEKEQRKAELLASRHEKECR